ncbi:hypothetical protein DICPUDRAFT_158818 [Dictyostelium purpureum]|uniref:Uncharacterized protein n=1 Tax=Dictyostelium purpureum TaxID=5786 RepID=F1A2K2_DICPU|nr:uncharacterized protein DICPUDRAFT_158818 [Dictyostelium purpureum]EGC29576.1 hypothetical protein DICPUDRAFT_158818 [Dictyostelium purpureum]|eukprot:XP_003293895.1 hypothetical protein DICPUDRAFT_158818 [Dictyostelium purpureum]
MFVEVENKYDYTFEYEVSNSIFSCFNQYHYTYKKEFPQELNKIITEKEYEIIGDYLKYQSNNGSPQNYFVKTTIESIFWMTTVVYSLATKNQFEIVSILFFTSLAISVLLNFPTLIYNKIWTLILKRKYKSMLKGRNVRVGFSFVYRKYFLISLKIYVRLSVILLYVLYYLEHHHHGDKNTRVLYAVTLFFLILQTILNFLFFLLFTKLGGLFLTKIRPNIPNEKMADILIFKILHPVVFSLYYKSEVEHIDDEVNFFEMDEESSAASKKIDLEKLKKLLEISLDDDNSNNNNNGLDDDDEENQDRNQEVIINLNGINKRYDKFGVELEEKRKRFYFKFGYEIAPSSLSLSTPVYDYTFCSYLPNELIGIVNEEEYQLTEKMYIEMVNLLNKKSILFDKVFYSKATSYQLFQIVNLFSHLVAILAGLFTGYRNMIPLSKLLSENDYIKMLNKNIYKAIGPLPYYISYLEMNSNNSDNNNISNNNNNNDNNNVSIIINSSNN